MIDHPLALAAALALLALPGLALGGLQLWRLQGQARLRRQRLERALGVGPQAGVTVTETPALLLRGERAWSRWPALDRALPRWPLLQHLDRLLQGSAWPWRLAETLAMSALLALLLGLLLALLAAWLRLPLALIAFAPLAAVALLVGLLLQRQQRQRQRIEAQLPDALELMARSLQAGHGLHSALQLAAREAPAPLAPVLQRLCDELEFGRPLQPALAAMAQRVGSEEVHFFVTAVLIQRESGGDLASLLQGMATMVRERQRLAAQVQVLSAEGRLSAWILSLLPLVLGLLMHLLNPGFVAPLWQSPQGQRLVGVALLLWLLGVAWMARLVRIRL